MKTETKTYPINLILNQRSCLVVGGGKVATRKVKGLLESDAKIIVVAPKVSKSLAELKKAGLISCHLRNFQDDDLDDIYLTFIATSDKKLNHHVLTLCQEKDILCCAVDHNWKNGHFITPASVEKHGIKIAISTNGNSCRRTRLIKDNLAKHVEMVENAELLIIGTDHNYLNLIEREPYHLVGNKFDQVGEMLSHLWGIHDYMVINTCNRIEVVAIVSPDHQLENLIKQILGFGQLPHDSYYVKYGLEAFGHLPSVLAGLMSQTPGEKHITSQLKDALNTAKDKNWSSSMIQEWMDSALHISKHIRQEVEPLLKNFEIEDLSLQFIKAECAKLAEKHVMLIGTGVVGETISKQILPEIASLTWCYHQNKPDNIDDKKCRIISLKNLKEAISEVDLIICATSSSTPLIHHGHAPFFDFSKQIMIVDLASPRNVSPELEKLMPNIKVTDLDDLKYWFRREAVDMAKIFKISQKLIDDHKELYDKILYHFQGPPLINAEC